LYMCTLDHPHIGIKLEYLGLGVLTYRDGSLGLFIKPF